MSQNRDENKKRTLFPYTHIYIHMYSNMPARTEVIVVGGARQIGEDGGEQELGAEVQIGINEPVGGISRWISES
jgi:hypothetical protein